MKFVDCVLFFVINKLDSCVNEDALLPERCRILGGIQESAFCRFGVCFERIPTNAQ